jgi:hypothetical protein
MSSLLLLKKKKSLGSDLLSQGVAPQVPSALTGLTTGFGMGPGVPPSLQPPRDSFHVVKLDLAVQAALSLFLGDVKNALHISHPQSSPRWGGLGAGVVLAGASIRTLPKE